MIEVQQFLDNARDPWYWEARGIPLDIILEAIQSLAYAHPIRIGLQLLMFTGCRIAELNKMKRDLLDGNVIYWQPGKNQDQSQARKERLPAFFMLELQEYWKRNKLNENRIYGWSANTLLRKFNGEVRPHLAKEW